MERLNLDDQIYSEFTHDTFSQFYSDLQHYTHDASSIPLPPRPAKHPRPSSQKSVTVYTLVAAKNLGPCSVYRVMQQIQVSVQS